MIDGRMLAVYGYQSLWNMALGFAVISLHFLLSQATVAAPYLV